jgi:hypothetical protein
MEDLIIKVIEEAGAMTEDFMSKTHPSLHAAKRLAEAAVELEFEVIEWHMDRNEETNK